MKGPALTVLVILAAAVAMKLLVHAAELISDPDGASMVFGGFCMMASFTLCTIIAFVVGEKR